MKPSSQKLEKPQNSRKFLELEAVRLPRLEGRGERAGEDVVLKLEAGEGGELTDVTWNAVVEVLVADLD